MSFGLVVNRRGQSRSFSEKILFVVIKMPKKIFDDETIGSIRLFLEMNKPIKEIQEWVSEKGLQISRSYLMKIKSGERKNPENSKKKKKRGRKLKLTAVRRRALKKSSMRDNPPTQRELAKRFNISQTSVRNYLEKFRLKLRKKRKCHELSPSSIEKRLKRSWPLYLKLRGNRWKKWITSDEALFTLENTTGERDVRYIENGSNDGDIGVKTHKHFNKSIMVWAAICSKGVIGPYFVEPGAKINSSYYIDKILKPLFERDAREFFPKGDFIFQQDSAPAHASKQTIKYIKSKKINFLRPSDWPPNSPDLAPCDFFLWGYLKKRLNRKKVTTIDGLKKAIRDELKKVPLDMINRALRSWPKRCRKVYYNKGGHLKK